MTSFFAPADVHMSVVIALLSMLHTGLCLFHLGATVEAMSQQQAAAPKSPPNFVQKPAVKLEGKTIMFTCGLTGEPEPEITWSHGDKPVVTSNRLKIRQERQGDVIVLFLEMTDWGEKDGGVYKVTAKNERGAANASLILDTKGLFQVHIRYRLLPRRSVLQKHEAATVLSLGAVHQIVN